MDKPDPVPTGPVRTVHLQIEREEIEEGNEPLMVKGYPNDLYAIQVYKGSISKYAYGIFNNIDELELKLEGGGSTYKIEVTMVGDGATRIAQDEVTNGYLEPFKLNGLNGGGTIQNNRFTYDNSIAFFKLSTGQAMINQEGGTAMAFDRAPVSRFYGLIEKFNPDENSSLNIKLKWVVFGLTIIPEGFTAGRIEIAVAGAPTMTITPANPTAVTKKIITFGHSALDDKNRDWCADDYSEEIPMTITWYKNDGTSVVLRDGAVTKTTFLRRTEKIIRLQLGDGSGNGNMSITKEDETLIGSPEEVLTIP